ncbi:MAG: hypothetical protein AB7N65_07735 [Vicinamibacterales bacterium]
MPQGDSDVVLLGSCGPGASLDITYSAADDVMKRVICRSDYTGTSARQ